MLARDSGEGSRLIRTSQRLLDRRSEYYDQLERAQHGDLDVTGWLSWFIEQVHASCNEASAIIDDTLAKARFWLDHSGKGLNERQRKVINLLLNAGPNGFEGGMSTKKYENVANTSRATASRKLIELQNWIYIPCGRMTLDAYYVKPLGRGLGKADSCSVTEAD